MNEQFENIDKEKMEEFVRYFFIAMFGVRPECNAKLLQTTVDGSVVNSGYSVIVDLPQEKKAKFIGKNGTGSKEINRMFSDSLYFRGVKANVEIFINK